MEVLEKMKKYVCLKHGNKYSGEYVNKLYRMCKKHTTLPFEFVCITERAEGLDPDIQIYPCPDWGVAGERKSWWYKVMLFEPRFQEAMGDEFIFFDLDVVIFNDIDRLWTYKPGQFVVIQDFNRCRIKNWHVRNSSVMKFHVGCENQVWHEFAKNKSAVINRMHGDQDWVTKCLPNSEMWPKSWVMSYKWEMGVHVRKPEFGQRHHIIDNRTIVENTLVIKNGVKQNVTTYKKPSITEETCVAVFHGRPNPEQCMEDPLVGDNWQ